jgi:uncharacterized protein YjbI with pentapeptide repeats
VARTSGDRPLPPRLPTDLEVVDLATVDTGEWDQVQLVGELPTDFDEPLLLTSVRINGASLVGARLEGSRLVDVSIVSSDFSGADLEGGSFTRVELSDVRLSGAQLAQTRWRDCRLVDCRMETANLAMCVGERIRFERCRLEDVDLRAAKFEGVAWWDCDLTNAEMSQITVARAQLHGSLIDGIRGATALSPIAIDADQFPAFAQLLLAAAGIVVGEREDD